MLDMLCELGGVELFKYSGKLQDLAFLKRRQQCAFLHCTRISTLQGQTLAGVAVSPLWRREEKGLQEAHARAALLLDSRQM